MEFIKQDPAGLGSRDLRHVLSDVIDIDEDGNAVGVFAAVGNLHLSRPGWSPSLAMRTATCC